MQVWKSNTNNQEATSKSLWLFMNKPLNKGENGSIELLIYGMHGILLKMMTCSINNYIALS